MNKIQIYLIFCLFQRISYKGFPADSMQDVHSNRNTTTITPLAQYSYLIVSGNECF